MYSCGPLGFFFSERKTKFEYTAVTKNGKVCNLVGKDYGFFFMFSYFLFFFDLLVAVINFRIFSGFQGRMGFQQHPKKLFLIELKN